MGYFLAKAREEAAAPYGGLETEAGRKAADAVDTRRFRHAGPKPQSREAALIMLADGVEASVRSLTRATSRRSGRWWRGSSPSEWMITSSTSAT